MLTTSGLHSQEYCVLSCSHGSIMMMNAGLGGGMNSVGTKVQHGTAHSAVQCSAVVND